MRKFNEAVGILILAIFALNLILMFNSHNLGDIDDSNNFFMLFLKSLGIESNQNDPFHRVSLLTRETPYSISHNQLSYNRSKIVLKLSDYYVPGWADVRWEYRKNITVDHLKVSADLLNFPVLIDIYDSDIQKDAQASGNDIIFSGNDGSILKSEIELYDRSYNSSHAHLVAWVRTNLSSTQDSIISMYYGNPSASSQESYSEVWDENYIGVWHLNENGIGILDEYKDSSQYTNHGQGGEGNISYVPTRVEGKLGFAQEFNNYDGYYDLIDCGNDSSFNITGFGITLEAWVQHNITPSSHVYGIMNHKGWYNGYSLWIDQLGLKPTFQLPGETHKLAGSSDITTNLWHHLVATYDGEYMRIYIDGNLEGTLAKINSIDPSDSEQDFWIGHGDQPQDKAWSGEWEGQIDEVRISDIGRSGEWIETEYTNQADPKSFFSISSEETYESDEWKFKMFQFRKNITIDSSNVPVDLYNFPLIIELFDAELHETDNVQSDGDDILFTDALGTKLNHEIELFDQNGNGTHAHLIAWVKVNLSSTQNSEFRLYYGNKAVSSQANPEGVWDENYAAVWHLGDIVADGTLGGIKDSTKNANDGTPQNFQDGGGGTNDISGQIGNAIYFGDNDYITISTPTNTDPTATLTISAWIMANTSVNGDIISRGDSYAIRKWPDGRILFYKYDGSSWVNMAPEGVNVTGNEFHYIVAGQNATGMFLYIDGEEIEVNSNTNPISYTLGNTIEIGRHGNGNNGYNFTGIIDEARISSSYRSASWIATEWANQHDPLNFYGISSQEIYTNWWLDSSFNYRTDIVVNHTQVENSSLYNFPVLIKLIDSKLKAGKIQPDASDLLFTDSTGLKLSHEVEFFTQDSFSGTLVAWVNVPILSATQDTILSMYYGNANLLNQEDTNGVWNSNYMGVWHLSEIPSGSLDEILDSTQNDNDGYTVGSMSADDLITSQIGYGLELDGLDDMLIMNDSASLDSINDVGTISLWINCVDPSAGDYQRIMVSSNTFPDRTTGLEVGLQPDGDVFFYPCEENADNYNLITNPFSENTWFYITFTHDFSTKTAKIFVNGVETPLTVENVPVNWTELAVINDWLWGGDNYHYKFLTGILDEMRVSDTTLSPEWIATEFFNQYNPEAFTTFGPEYILDLNPPILNNFGVDDEGTGIGRFWADISDVVSDVSSVTIKINNTDYMMSFNGTYWIYQKAVMFQGYYEFQIANASDIRENYISTPSIIKNYTFILDKIAPEVIAWEYYDDLGIYGTFKANLTDSWGVIDTVIVNITEGEVSSGERWAIMTQTTSGYVNDTIALSPGTIKYVIFANDSVGNSFISAEHQGLVLGTNQVPLAENVTLSRSQISVLLPIYSNSILYLDYDYSDPDLDPEEAPEICWYKNGVHQATYDDLDAIPASALVKGDQWNASIRPYDGQDYGDIVFSLLVVIQNTPPTATSVVVLPSSPLTTSTLSVSYSYTDYDGDSQNTGNREIRWYKEGVLQIALNDSLSVNSALTNKGEEWYYELRVHDGTNYSSWILSSSVIIANSAPSATAVQITPGAPVTSTTLTASYTFSDIDFDSESGSLIRWYKNGVLQVFLNDSLIVDASYTLKGENWYYTVQPSDGTAYGTLKQAPSVVIGNTAPTVSTLQITPSPAYTTDTLWANYTYYDADSDSESEPEIVWYKNGVLQGTLNNSINVTSSFSTKNQVWHFKVRPSDGFDSGIWYSCPVNITIQNTNPSVSNLGLDPSLADTTDDLLLSYDYYDADLDPEIGTEVLWYLNGILQQQLNDSLELQAGNTTKGQVWHIKIRVFDGSVFSLWLSLENNMTINNTPPIASDVRINGNNAPTQISDIEDLIGSYDYFDADGDLQINASRQVFWYKKNQSESSFILQSHLNNLLIVGEGNTSFGDTWYFIIRVYDGTNYSVFASSPSVSIGVPPNTPPEVYFLNITPTFPVTSDILFINYTYVDSDGNNESGSLYYWYRNGIHLPEYDGLRTLPAFATAKGDLWHVKVRPRDGIDFGQLIGVSINVTIRNTPPEVSSLQILPLTPKTASDLTVSYSFFDIDSDSESGSDIIWFRDGVLQGTLNGSFSVSAVYTTKGQKWHFKLLPKDGSDVGTWTSCPTNITIGNTAPTAATLTINPTNPKTGQDLTGNYIFSDPDEIVGDIEINSLIRWFRNGVEQTTYENQTTIPYSATQKGENWWFEITPCDGVDYGVKKTSALITIQNTTPSANQLIFTPSDPMTGDDLTVTYTYSDVDNDYEYGTQILWFKNGILELTYTDTKTVDGAALVKGDRWNVSIKVSDGLDYGLWLNDSIIIINAPPMIVADSAEILVPSEGLFTTSSLTAIWNTYDADGDPIIEYKIIWENRTSGVGGFIPQLALENFTEVSAFYTKKNQDWRFKIQIFDGEAWSLSTTSFLATIQNSEPIVENIYLSGGETTTDSITVTYDFFDADGDPDQSEILWGIFHLNPPFRFIAGTQILPSTEFAAGDLIWVEITPDDNDASTGQGDSIDTSRLLGAGKQIQVGDTAPQINTTLDCPTILADHPDGPTLYTASYSLYVNYSGLVFDIDSGESSSIFDISLSYNDDIYYNNVYFVIGTQYRWYKYNTETGLFQLQMSQTGMVVEPYYLQKGDQWIVSVRPRDNYGYYGSWVNSTPIMIGNSYPQVLGFKWTKSSPTTSDDLTFSFIYFDYDGDLLVESQTLILWFKNGFLITGAINQSVLTSGNFIKGDNITVEIRPFDGTDWAGRSYNSFEFVGTLVIVNSPPVATNVSLLPLSPSTIDQLTLTWIFNDADDDSENSNYIIEWRRSGVIIPELENMTFVPSSYTSKGETWQARIWVFDGQYYSSIGYSSNEGNVIFIQNTPMEITTIQFTGLASEALANDTLMIEWDISDVDNDGQLDYAIYWYCNNGSGIYNYQPDYELHTNFISPSNIFKGQLWYCIVKVYDGDDWSLNTTSPVISIINTAPEVKNVEYIFNRTTSQVDPDIRVDEFYIEDENINISFNYYDLDNDAPQIKIEWFKIINESIIEMTSYENASFIPSYALSHGEIWFFRIIPYDGILAGFPINSSRIPIYSRPTCYSHDISPDSSSEGIYRINVSVTDDSFEVIEVQISTLFYDNSSKIWFASNYLGDNWTLLFELEDLVYLNTNLSIYIKCITEVTDTDFEIYSIHTFNMLLEDKAPPRVIDAFFNEDDKVNPTNLTFNANIQEFGIGIAEVLLYYYFSPVIESGGNGAEINQNGYNTVLMNFDYYNISGNYYVYAITVNFIHNNTDTDIIYWISTTDNAGNNNPYAFDIRDYPQRIKEQRYIYTPPGLPEEILLIAVLIIFIIFVGAVVYVKFIRKPELVGLDKELVLTRTNEIPEQEILESLDQHTIGIVISFFDQRHGPIPIVINPEILKDNFNKLVELSDRSFSGTGFSDNFNVEIPSSYDFVLDLGTRTSVMSFGFALNRPAARGGQENLTLNILVHHDLFPLVQSFQKEIQLRTHSIHLIMDDESTEKEILQNMLIELRKYISSIILSYKYIYGTTDLLEEKE